MAILSECPKCKSRNSTKKAKCRCGFNLKKASGKVYWIEYYISGHRKRERIGPSKAAAEQRLREVLKARTEERYIDRNKNIRVTFNELAMWYLELPQIKAKRSYTRDVLSMKTLKRFYGGKVVQDLTINQVEAYRQKRLNEDSYRKQKTRPATINREIACLRHMLNLAEQDRKIDSLPFKGLKALKENNVRNRLLSRDEYERLLKHCPYHTANIVKMAYHTAMRQGEILNLTWDRVDLKNGVVRLAPGDTKTDEKRVVPLHPEVVKMLNSIPRTLRGRVFTRDGKPLTDIKKSFRTACNEAEIEDFRFHDLRHTCINNWRLQGHDFFRIMAASGHKTMEVFKRYNTVTEDEVKKLVEGPVDTYMDTKKEKGQAASG
ncbi:tyrosine-type recombinase/integrase [Thermodesulfobacteriota bacterium]